MSKKKSPTLSVRSSNVNRRKLALKSGEVNMFALLDLYMAMDLSLLGINFEGKLEVKVMSRAAVMGMNYE